MQKWWTVIKCDPSQKGADAVIECFGLFYTEDEALDFLADVRDDDPETGDGWTRVEISTT